VGGMMPRLQTALTEVFSRSQEDFSWDMTFRRICADLAAP
jgi:hypothetical protein